MLSAAILAGCTLPNQNLTATTPTSLEPVRSDIAGLSPDHTRGHPTDVHITPDGRTAFVPMPGTISRPLAHVVAVDLTNGDLVATIDVGLRPLSLTPDPLDPDRLLVAHPYTNAITIIDTERRAAAQSIPAPFYLEHLAFAPDGATLVATDRGLDRLVVYDVTRDERSLTLHERRSIPTGPNPEHVTFVGTGNGSIVAATDRHGASITIADIDNGNHRRIPTGGPPLALAQQDGILFVAGLGPGSGANASTDGTTETGTADIENSLLVVDLREATSVLAAQSTPVPSLRYVSDTARDDRAHASLRILAGATPRALAFDNDTLWVTYHGTDQVQRLTYSPPAAGAGVTTGLLTTHSGTAGTRLSHIANDTALGPGRLGDAVHGVHETPPGPRATARSGDLLVTVAELSEQIQVLDLTDCPGPAAPNARCTHAIVDLVADPVPYPSGPYEEGERLFVSALPSADQDRSCASCHMDGLSTGQTWRLPHRNGTEMLIPRLDQGPGNAPWLIDGSLTEPAGYMRAAGGDMLGADDGDPWNLSPANETARDAAFAARASALVPDVRDPATWLERTFAYALGELRILPVPPYLDEQADEHPDARPRLTGSRGCFSCHMPDDARVFDDPTAVANIPHPPGADAMKARPLGGIWDRNGTRFLYDGSATNITEAVLPQGDKCLPANAGQPTAWHGELDEYDCWMIHATVDHLYAHTRDP